MPKAIFEGIYRDLKGKIQEGTYSYQELLPSEGELTAEYGCSRNTLRRAVSMLADDAYVQPMHGRGVRVIWQREAHSAQDILEGVESFGEYARRNGFVPGTQVKSFEHVTCGAGLARRTGFAEGVELVRVVRVRTLDDVARQIDHDYFLALRRSRAYRRAGREVRLQLSRAQPGNAHPHEPAPHHGAAGDRRGL